MKGLKRCRRAAGLSVDGLAVRLGVTRQCVYLWESGERLPTADKLPEIARVLGCSVDELFREDGEADCHIGLCPPRNDKDTKTEEIRP